MQAAVTTTKRASAVMTALVAIISIMLGTLIAVTYIPNYTRTMDALFWPGVFMSIGLLAVLPFKLSGGIITFLRAENILMVGLVYWLLLDLLQKVYFVYGVDHEDIKMAFLAIGVMAIAIWLGTLGKSWRLPRVVVNTASENLSSRSLLTASILAFILGMFHYIVSSHFDPVVMYKGLLGNRWSAPWNRGQLGGWESFSDHMRYFGYALPSLTVVLAHRRGWLRGEVLVSILFTIIVLLFLSQGGGRRIIGVTIGAAIVCWVILQQKIRLKQIVIVALTILFTLQVMQTMLLYRLSGYGSLLEGKEPQQQLDYFHVDDNFLRLSQVIHIFPEQKDYVGFKPVFYALARPIPRVFWPGKPVSPGYDLTSLVGMRGVSLSHTIIGELYACYGLIAIFIGGWFLGRLATMLNQVLQIKNSNTMPLVYGLGIMTLFTALRSMQDLVIISYGLLGWILIATYISRRQRKKSRRRIRYTSIPGYTNEKYK